MVALEANLLMLALSCPRFAELRMKMAPTMPFGLQVVRNGQVMGIWSERHGVLVFRNLVSWRSRMMANTPAEAIAMTIAMAEANSWLD